jgi:hypothetical protein
MRSLRVRTRATQTSAIDDASLSSPESIVGNAQCALGIQERPLNPEELGLPISQSFPGGVHRCIAQAMFESAVLVLAGYQQPPPGLWIRRFPMSYLLDPDFGSQRTFGAGGHCPRRTAIPQPLRRSNIHQEDFPVIVQGIVQGAVIAVNLIAAHPAIAYASPACQRGALWP